jgi:hypothetical protein
MNLYRLLLNLYPDRFLREFREPMEQAYRDHSQLNGAITLWINLLGDLMRSVPATHLDEIRRNGMKNFTTPAAWLFCLAAMAFIGRVELHSDDAGVIVALVLMMTFTLGCLHPKRAWIWALAALCVPGAELIWGKNFMLDPSHPFGMLMLAGFVTAIGLAGSYAGAFARIALVQHKS